ncbi:restriction endonuclease [Bradyrhizobium sp. CCBAU 25360]|uniref:nSTAND3 domain-containing NTPase n=1 Tax=Bradyrhizobium sp. CCBAU 25360 TaxID=858425 RepID=UPI002305AC77|nr:restriction endonuclease [Bradyrhizobium sp. CCBAU 25360]
MQYDFQQLSPHDLEILARDLLQADWGVVLESFKTGRDGGIDLRYARGGNNLVVQVKHYVRTGLAGLLRDLKVEAGKIPALKPSRYVLVTSVPLSPANKQAIAAVLGGGLAIGDVLGQEDLNNFLGRHPEVEHRHYKLWLASRAVLDRVLHSDVITQTEFQIEKIHATIRRNVRSDAYSNALKILEQNRVVIISGAPGVGKTTLASMLLYTHLERGWEPVVIRRDLAEGQKLFQRGKRQIFQFDDFMGATFLGDHASGFLRNEDRLITDFIEMVRASPNARLVLTTREHIFGQAVAASERLRQAGLDGHRIVLRVGDYNFGQKAQILYNHLYFSDLPDAYRDALLRSDFYLEVVRHPKFNPRLIEWLSSFSRIRSISPSGYQDFVRNLLRDPSEVWLHAYDHQLSDAGRSLLLTLYSHGGKAEGVVLQPTFKKLHKARAMRWGFPRKPEDWATAMAELQNAFLRPTGRNAFEVLDPSVIDLVNAVIRRAPENAVDLVVGAVDFSQIERVWKISESGVQGIKAALIQSGGVVAASIESAIARSHRLVELQNGAGLIAWTEEARFAAFVPLADAVRTKEMRDIAKSLGGDMSSSWRGRAISIIDGVDALRALERVSWEPLRSPKLEQELIEQLLKQAQVSCRSVELSEIVSVLDLEEPRNAPRLAALQAAFENSRYQIASDIDECRKEEDFKGLRGAYELFASSLGVDVSPELERLEEVYAEYTDYEEQRAEGMMDEYRDRQRESRHSEDSVRDMFGSLRSDRAD